MSSLRFSLLTVALILRNIILRLYPPPTLLGSAPSVIAKINVRKWSAIRYIPSIGVIIFVNCESVIPAFLIASRLTSLRSS